MEKMNLMIKNGTVVLPTGLEQIDIGVKDGRIHILGKNLLNDSEKIWDATNQYVFPDYTGVEINLLQS